jgi:PKHD-type hydroxylase
MNIINNIGKKSNLKEGQVGRGDVNRTDPNVRSTDITFFNSLDESNEWIYKRLTDSIININQRFWNFDLTRIETLQYSVYNKGQFYRNHIDAMYTTAGRASRKLSFSVQLSSPDEYEGGELLFKLGPDDQKAKNEKGTIIFFPSYVLHEVTTITKGTRRALVGWVTGPAFK